MPQYANAGIKPLLSVGPFKGLDATTDPTYLEGAAALDLANLVPNRTYQAYATIRGRTVYAPTIPAGALLALSLYDTAAGTNIVAVADNGGTFGVAINYLPPGGVSWQTLTMPYATATNPGVLESYLDWLFFSNGDDGGRTYKADRAFGVTLWQIFPPAAAPTVALSTPANGGLYGAGYYWRTTFSNAVQESSPSPPLGPQDVGLVLGPPQTNAIVFVTGVPNNPSTAVAGTIPAGTYNVLVTFNTPFGESAPTSGAFGAPLAAPGSIAVAVSQSAGSIPVFPSGATSFNTYIAAGSGPFRLQSGAATPLGATNTVSSYNAAGVTPPQSQIGTTADPPAIPQLTTTPGGAQAARTAYAAVSYVDLYGRESTASQAASVVVPANALVVVASPVGSVNVDYYNVYASDAAGQEVKQNASPIPIGTNWTEPAGGLVLGQAPTLSAPGSSDPQVTTVDFYRIGGSLGQWLFVGSVPNNPAGVTFVDTTADAQVTGQSLVLHRDPPPPFYAIRAHKERMWGFGYPAYTDPNGVAHAAAPSDLWYSNYAEPWGFDDTNQVIPVDPHTFGDVAVALASTGSDLICFTNKKTFVVYGETPASFFVHPLFQVGCASAASVVSALGVVFWLSNQGVYMFDGASLTYLSAPVKKLLDGLSAADFAVSSGAFSDRMYWLSFPNQHYTLGYDTVTQTWWKARMSTARFAYDPESATRAASPDLVVGMRLLGSALVAERWFAAETDRGLPIVSSLTSRIASTQEDTIATLRARFLELNATLGPNDTVTVTIDANVGFDPPAYSVTFTAGTLPRQVASLPPGIQGQNMQLTIAATTSEAFTLQSAAVYGWVRRLFGQRG